jgi:hypothetical protein
MLQKKALNEPIFLYANYPNSKYITSLLIDQNSISFDLDDGWIDGHYETGFLDQVMKEITDLCFDVLGPFGLTMSRYVDRI